MIHRDLKPGNIMLTKGGAKLLDFGLAQAWLSPEWARIGDSPRQRGPDHKGIVIGTPGYIAPERLKGIDSDASADLFAFGAVLYEMMAGRKAFTGATPAEIMQSVLAGRLRRLPSAARCSAVRSTGSSIGAWRRTPRNAGRLHAIC